MGRRRDAARSDRRRRAAPTRRRAGGPVLRRDVPPSRVHRRHRHAARRVRGPRIRGRPTSGQARRADRIALPTRRVRRPLGAEMVRRAAREVGVPDRPLAERRAGVPPLDSRRRAHEHAVRQVRARVAHGVGQQLPRPAGELLARRPGAFAGRAGVGRGADVHGRALREVAGGATRHDVALLLARRLEEDRRVEGGDRPPRSGADGRARHVPARRDGRARRGRR